MGGIDNWSAPPSNHLKKLLVSFNYSRLSCGIKIKPEDHTEIQLQSLNTELG